ncbi:hypothetical protein DL767_008038 [Monosporascus sp. MG133]|nr:hypothetical protein DL767_008038 [Monosporascus sp. MG133]
MTVWNDLPAELRLVVYKHLDNVSFRKLRVEDVRHYHHMAAYAAVSREWQEFFEERTFKSLVLRQRDLPELERILNRSRRRWLCTLWLRVELPRYTCDSCSSEESDEEADTNSAVFTAAVWKLFTVLNGWQSRGQEPLTRPGFDLRLSVYSPSDREHHFRHHRFDDDFSALCLWPRINHLDHSHGWYHGTQLELSLGAKLRILGKPLKLDLSQVSTDLSPHLPPLNFITCFTMPRQFYRRIADVDSILQSLPNLRRFYLEQWRQVTIADENERLLHLRRVIEALPPTLRLFSAFQDANNTLLWSAPNSNLPESDAPSARILRKASQKCTVINAYFLIDARCFFFTFEPGSPGSAQEAWPNLKKLTMTSDLLSSKAYGDRSDRMLEAASRAALRMPKLRMLQLWFIGGKEVCIFRYRKTKGRPLIEWLRTKSARRGPSQGVVQAWQMVADTSLQGPIRVQKTEIPTNWITKSRGSVVYHYL